MPKCSKCGRCTKGHPLPVGKDCVIPPLDIIGEDDQPDKAHGFFSNFGILPPKSLHESEFSLDSFDPLSAGEKWSPLNFKKDTPLPSCKNAGFIESLKLPYTPQAQAASKDSSLLMDSIKVMQESVCVLTQQVGQLTLQFDAVRKQQQLQLQDATSQPTQPANSLVLQSTVTTMPIYTSQATMMPGQPHLQSTTGTYTSYSTSVQPTAAVQPPVTAAFPSGPGWQLPATRYANPQLSAMHVPPTHPPMPVSAQAAMMQQQPTQPSPTQLRPSLPTPQPPQQAQLQPPAPVDVLGSQYPPPPTSDIVLGDAVVPLDIVSSAIQGSFVELSKFLIIPNPGAEQETVTVRNNKITVTSKLTGTPITSYELWLSAWANYEEVLMRYLPPEYDVYQ